MPEISVIVPNYNHAAYLEQRIESLLAQTFRDFELILLDDASQDASAEILARYADHPKVSRIVRNHVNSGSVFRQWHAGIGLAQGRYVLIAESDDWCEPALLQALWEGIQSDPDCVLSYCQSMAVEEGRIVWSTSAPFLAECLDGVEFMRRYWHKRATIVNAGMALWRREAYARAGCRYLDYRSSGDWMFWISLAALGKVHISGRVLNYFRRHPGCISLNAARNGLALLEDMEILNYMYRQGWTDDEGYAIAFKRRYQLYVLHRQAMSVPMREQLQRLFDASASPRVGMLGIRLSAQLRKLKQMRQAG